MTSSEGGKFWNFLGRWLPWLGTPGLLKAVVLLNALTFLLITAAPDYAEVLSLDPAKIMQGEVWRLVTYIFVPETRSVFWILFALLFLWFLATSLEEMWGPLRLNVFYLVGMAGCTAAAFFFGGGPSNTFLNLSLSPEFPIKPLNFSAKSFSGSTPPNASPASPITSRVAGQS